MKDIGIIITLYMSLLNHGLAPPIMFTDKNVYRQMYNDVKDLLPMTPKVQFVDQVPDFTYDKLFLTV